eukprot:6187583-Pleurochrysis_carterae.AAC.5
MPVGAHRSLTRVRRPGLRVRCGATCVLPVRVDVRLDDDGDVANGSERLAKISLRQHVRARARVKPRGACSRGVRAAGCRGGVRCAGRARSTAAASAASAAAAAAAAAATAAGGGASAQSRALPAFSQGAARHRLPIAAARDAE